MGRLNKLLAEINGIPMVVRVATAAVESVADPVIVVTGYEGERVAQVLQGLNVMVVHNDRYEAGLSTSLVRGLSALPDKVAGVLVCLGDMPGVKAAQLDRLIRAFEPQSGRAICVPTHRGQRGNPVLWSSRFFPRMLGLSGDAGARGLITKYEKFVCEVPMDDDGILLDVDAPDALAALDGVRTDAIAMNDTLYHQAIVTFASAATGEGRLVDADATVTLDNPLCGDQIILDIRMGGGSVTALGYRVKACILCEAAASIIGTYAPGESATTLRSVSETVSMMLSHGSDAPSGPWKALSTFKPVRNYRSRHNCVVLPFRALQLAIDQVDEQLTVVAAACAKR